MKRIWLLAIILTSVLVVAAVPATAQTLLGPPLRGPRPQPEVIPGQYIVELHRGVAQDALLRDHGVIPRERWTVINGFVAQLPQPVVNRLAADLRVLSITPDLVVHAFPAGAQRKPGGGGGGGGSAPISCPNPGAAESAVPQTAGWGVAHIGADPTPGALTGSGVTVAIIDTGIDYCHPDLSGNYHGGYNFLNSSYPTFPQDDNGHGTHVAGIVAASDNGFGVVGVAPQASLYAVKVLDKNGSGSLSTVVSGINWAASRGIKVANLSLGAVDSYCTLFGICGTTSLCSAIANATAGGMTVVVAAGNSKDEALYYTPANCLDSVTVSAFDQNDQFAAWFSNYSSYYWDMSASGTPGALDYTDHPIIDFTAPGVGILSTLPTYSVTLTSQYGLNYGSLTGTSMATPHVTGAVARYIQANPSATPDEIRQALVHAGECPSGTVPSPIEPRCEMKWPQDPDTFGEPLIKSP